MRNFDFGLDQSRGTIFSALLNDSNVNPQNWRDSRKRMEYAGGYKMRNPTMQTLASSSAAQTLDKNTVYSMLGYHFKNQQSQPPQSEQDNDSDVVIKRHRQINCKYKPVYNCYHHQHTGPEGISLKYDTLFGPQSTKLDPDTKYQQKIAYIYQPNPYPDGKPTKPEPQNQQQHKHTGVHELHVQQYRKKRLAETRPRTSQPKIPVPTQKQQRRHMHGFKEHIQGKRDMHFAQLLFKLIRQKDFERFQCTSPNQVRVEADWNGLFHPKDPSMFAQSKEGLSHFRKFLFWYICKNRHNANQPYDAKCIKFIEQFETYIRQIQACKRDPTKALSKLNLAELVAKSTKQKIPKIRLLELLHSLPFLLLLIPNDPTQMLAGFGQEISYSDMQRLL